MYEKPENTDLITILYPLFHKYGILLTKENIETFLYVDKMNDISNLEDVIKIWQPKLYHNVNFSNKIEKLIKED